MSIADRQISIDTFESLNPATGDVVGTFPIAGPEDVRAAVERAHRRSLVARPRLRRPAPAAVGVEVADRAPIPRAG
jgi:acyl-CoA reductase-like NAD-dependent aldehyde dehydrogenase